MGKEQEESYSSFMKRNVIGCKTEASILLRTIGMISAKVNALNGMSKFYWFCWERPHLSMQKVQTTLEER